MKRYLPPFRLLCAALAAGFICQNAFSEITLFPNPGDFSRIEGIRESSLIDMSVNGEDAFVYHAFEETFNKYGYAKKGGHFLAFEMDEGEVATVRLQVAGEIEFYDVLPRKYAVEQIDRRTLEFKLFEPCKFLTKIWIDGEEQRVILSAEKPEVNVPLKNDPSVLYLETGVHQFGRTWDPFVEGIKTLYLEPGAVVQATIRSINKDGVRICGKGIFAQAVWENGKQVSPLKAEWMADMMGTHFRDSKNLSVEGITVVNCPSYQLEFADCENVEVRNVKLLGFGESNNDGMHLYGRHILVEDSFIAASDDRICVTGLFDREKFEVTNQSELQPRLEDTEVYDLRIRNNVFWGQKNGGDIMITWNGGKICRDVVVEDCVSLGLTNKGFLSAKHGGSVVAEKMTFRNIDIYHRRLVSLEVKEASCWGAGGGAIRNLLLENIRMHVDVNAIDLKMLGHSDESDIRNIVFDGLYANGHQVMSLEETSIKTNEFVENVVFK